MGCLGVLAVIGMGMGICVAHLCCCCCSTRDPPNKQLLIGLGAGGASLPIICHLSFVMHCVLCVVCHASCIVHLSLFALGPDNIVSLYLSALQAVARSGRSRAVVFGGGPCGVCSCH
jgi:hypothetical protein